MKNSITNERLTIAQGLELSGGPRRPKEWAWLYVKGVAMGIADLIPGVSGGTIAFITGIYDGLMQAASSLHLRLLRYFFTGRFGNILAEVPLRFAIPLLAGIATSIFSMARLMHYLMHQHPVPTWALFFGLISASIWVVGAHIQNVFSPYRILMIIVGAIFAYVVVGLIPIQTPESWWFIYLCGIIGITAMILPGISGSFLLLVLGKYEYITGAVKAPFVPENFVILVIFSLGCISGLVGFTRLLNYFLTTHRQSTMALLTGILIGSQRKVWPWKDVVRTDFIAGKERILEEANRLPTMSGLDDYLGFVLIAVGIAIVVIIELTSRHRAAQA